MRTDWNGLVLRLALLLCLSGLFAVSTALAEESTGEGTAGVYDIRIEPLTVADCARCHYSHYNRLRDNGAKHGQVVCMDCHEQFHVYNPVKNNFAEIMPKCSSCHDAPHGDADEVRTCLGCHADPHQPLASIPDPAELDDRCAFCHTAVADSLQAKPTKHTEQNCSACHSEKHGRKPDCNECHESHSPMVVMGTADCLACHPVHTPLEIAYPADQNNQLCAGCHADPYQLLTDKQTKHSAFSCAKCHPSHGQLMACSECHGEPHNLAIHEKFPVCGSCHNIAHDLEK
jgi:predicted CXXCH cytochrome family protein